MKGIVFTEFVEFMESTFGVALADEVLEGSNLASRGAYTTVAYYDHGEIVAMLESLVRLTQRPPANLLRSFGHHLFGQLARGYPHLLAGLSSTFVLLQSLEERIHSEVRKLYPEADPPPFNATPRRRIDWS